MSKVLTDGETKIGAYLFPDRKNPSLCVAKGNCITIYGRFNSMKSADEFMDELGRLVKAEMEETE